MDFAYDTTTTELQERLTAFMEEFIYPAEETFFEQRAKMGDRWSSPAIVEELKARHAPGSLEPVPPATRVRRGLDKRSVRSARRDHGAQRCGWRRRHSTARRPTPATWSCSRCSAPRAEERWLRAAARGQDPLGLLDDRAAVGSSDARNIATDHPRRRRVHHQRAQVVDVGRDVAACQLLIVMGVTDPEAETYRRQSMILVPKDTPGSTSCVPLKRVRLRRRLPRRPRGNRLRERRVPATTCSASEGEGFRIAQERLGPGRIHHAMRTIGMAERAL